jgi:hypothetical protein
MSTKFQAKKRKAVSRQKNLQKEDEIVEIKEIPLKKSTRKNQKIAENSTSEATSPNKKNIKKQNKKKNNTNLIEIMDVDTPEDDITPTKKINSPTIKLKKSFYKKKAKGKSPKVNGKKNNKKIASITLDESENENENQNQIKVGSEPKSRHTNGKSSTKITDIKNINKIKENALVREKKNKKNGKRNIKRMAKKEDIVQCELSSESENEKIKEIKYKPNKIKFINRTDEKGKYSSDIFNSGYFSSRKVSKRRKQNKENEGSKPRSSVKISLRDDSIKSKMSNLLGKKRKHENTNQNSLSPKKKPRKSETNTQNQKRNPPNQNNAGKQKSRTPLKSNEKKDNKNKIDLNSSQMDIDAEENSQKTYSTPELAVLNQLISEYGFEKVLNSFCKSNFDEKNKLDSCLQGLKNSCSNEKLPFLLIKMLYSYFDSRLEEKNNVSDKKRSTSAIRATNLKNLVDNSTKEKPNSSCQNEEKEKIDNNIVKDQCEKGNPNEINEGEMQETQEKNKNSVEEKNKNKGTKNNTKGEEKKSGKKMMSIGSHYNKAEDGNVYKFQVAGLDGKGNAVFKCYDDKCNGMGIYNIETKKFSITKKHNILHAEHDYILNNDKDSDNVFKDLIEMGKSDAQVFKENGERTVKMY